MGLTLKRCAFGALAVAAILLPLRKPRGDTIAADGSTPSKRLDSLYWQLRSARLSWSAFELRDSATRLLTTTHQGAGRPSIALRGFAGTTALAAADSEVDRIWTKLGTTRPDVHTSVLVYNNTAYRRSSYAGAFITHDGSITNCVAIAPASVGGTPLGGEAGRIYLWRDNLAESLAPCALLAVFGMPGQAVNGWLTSTGYSPAQSNQWLTPTSYEFRRGPWVEWNDRTQGRFWPDEMYGWWATTGVIGYAMVLRPPYYYGAAGIRCIKGDEQSCVDGVLHSAIVLPTADSLPGDLTLSAWSTSPTSTTVGTVRPPAPRFVAAIITEFGREKFQRFWSSDQPFEAAFQSAFGESLGAWTARWAAREWAGSYEAKHGNPEILLGVTLKPSWFPLLIGWSAFAVAIAASVARRRTA